MADFLDINLDKYKKNTFNVHLLHPKSFACLMSLLKSTHREPSNEKKEI